jgi:hypothetical protein
MQWHGQNLQKLFKPKLSSPPACASISGTPRGLGYRYAWHHGTVTNTRGANASPK